MIFSKLKMVVGLSFFCLTMAKECIASTSKTLIAADIYVESLDALCTYAYIRYNTIVDTSLPVTNKIDEWGNGRFIISSKTKLDEIAYVLKHSKACKKQVADSLDARIVILLHYSDKSNDFAVVGSAYTPFIYYNSHFNTIDAISSKKLSKIFNITFHRDLRPPARAGR